jgi:hypothetical protein
LYTITPASEPAGVETDSDTSLDETIEKLQNLCKDSTLTADRFLEMKREEIALEEAKFRRMFHKGKN